jgi:hypothetical protein
VAAYDARAAAAKLRTVAVRIGHLMAAGKPYAQYDRKLPEIGGIQRFKQVLITGLKLRVNRARRLRRLILRVLISRPAVPLIYLRQIRKFGFAGFRYVESLTPKPNAERSRHR